MPAEESGDETPERRGQLQDPPAAPENDCASKQPRDGGETHGSEKDNGPPSGIAGAPPEAAPREEGREGGMLEGLHRAIAKLEVVQHQLGLLNQQFDAKFRHDAHKERIIDNLHNELQEYKSAFFSRHQHAMTMDMIKVIDDVRKFAAHHRALPSEKRDAEKLLDYLEQIPSDLEDLFALRGITAFQEPSFHLDPTRQRITHKIATADPLQDKTVAASLRPGYECEGRVIRPEMVAVYVYLPPSGETETRDMNA
jgi:molecular chaperone GrpE